MVDSDRSEQNSETPDGQGGEETPETESRPVEGTPQQGDSLLAELDFLKKVPWEKATIWALFLLLLWTLREFFAVILFTFIFAYVANSIVRFFEQWWPRRRLLTIFVYAGFLALIFGPGSWLGNRVIEEARPITRDAGNYLYELTQEGPEADVLNPNRESQDRESESQEDSGSDAGTPSGESGDDADRDANASSSPSPDSSSSDGDERAPPSGGDSPEGTGNQDTTDAGPVPLFQGEEEGSLLLLRVTPEGHIRPIEINEDLRGQIASLLQEGEEEGEVGQNNGDASGEEEREGGASGAETEEPRPIEGVSPEIQNMVEQILYRSFGNEWATQFMNTQYYHVLLREVDQIWASAMSQVTQRTTEIFQNIFRYVLFLLISLLFSFIIVFDVPRLKRRLDEFGEGKLRDFYREIAPSISSFGIVMGRTLQAQAVIALVNALSTWIVLALFGVPHALMLSALVFFCSFVPVLGLIAAAIPISVVSLATYGIGTMIAIIIIFTGIHCLEAYVLNPNIYGAHLKMHPLLVLIVLLVAEHFFGIWGLVLGVPVSVYLLEVVAQNRTVEELFQMES